MEQPTSLPSSCCIWSVRIPYYDITVFVADNTKGEILIAGNSSQDVIFRSGPRKVKLENDTLA